MPEIAEVALMADAIRLVADKRQIKDITILGGRYTKRPLILLDQLKECLPLTVSSVNTKGKRCWLELEADWFILISFGMTGAIYYEPTEEDLVETGVDLDEYKKYYHIRVDLGDDCFYFGDVRQFGSWKIFQGKSGLDQILDQIGPDMLTGPAISNKEFIDRLRKFNHLNICKVLMAQSAVSGVGNYICSESLYRSLINPYALIKNLSDHDLTNLYEAIREIAQKAYQAQGASLYTYTGAKRQKGSFQELLQVYRRSHDPDGRVVKVIPADQSPDRRTKHYVPEIQTIGVRKIPRPFLKMKRDS